MPDSVSYIQTTNSKWKWEIKNTKGETVLESSDEFLTQDDAAVNFNTMKGFFQSLDNIST